jgi:N-acylneuraminate cytidylyltransferase
MTSKVVAFIPLRGGSKSLPLKNIKEIAGKPLSLWVIEAAVKSNIIDEVYVSTDSERIRKTINKFQHNKLKIIGRSPETATDTASSESAMKEFAENYDFDFIFLIQATSPLLKSSDIDEAFETYTETGADSLLSVVRQKRFIWKEDGNFAVPLNYDPDQRPRRQDFDGALIENGAFYLTSRKKFLENGNRISGKIAVHEMDEESYIELDEKLDWKIIESLLIEKKLKKKYK